MRTNIKTVIMAILFAVSAFLLVGKVLMPTPIQIVIPGEEPIIVGQIFRYTQFDVAIISVSTVIMALSSFYLLFMNSMETRNALSTAEKKDASELDIQFALRLLDGDKRKVFNEIVESGGEILQSDLHMQTGFPKSKITRILDYLELKELIVRKSHGMTNKIVINKNRRIKNTK
ncbi:MAG: hypothetical protein JSW14_06905 [Candidatus Bathyarchaeum sp.]|nr:MAG: hypothetical protein JSW14_06905 [Candidatus Bathyarchaeum sp.]